MPKTTFILVTVLFGVICGNRLMDHRFLRSPSTSSSSYAESYKSMGDVSLNSFEGKMDDDSKQNNLEKLSKPLNLPCANNIDFQRGLPTSGCNDNTLNPNNYLSYDSSDSDDVMHYSDGKSYSNGVEFDDVFEAEQAVFKKSSKNMGLLQSKLSFFPVANYKDFYDDLVGETVKEEVLKRNGNSLGSVLGSPPSRGCDCKLRNDLVDLGQQHFPRYLLNAVCHSEHSRNDLGPKCWTGSVCRPLEYKVKVLTFRTLMDNMQKDPTLAWLPDDLRPIWKFKTITVTAGCFCS